MTSLEKRYRGILIEIPKQTKTKKMTAKEKELLLANKKITKLRKLLYQVEVYMEQNNMNDEYDEIWRDDDETILANVKQEAHI